MRVFTTAATVHVTIGLDAYDLLVLQVTAVAVHTAPGVPADLAIAAVSVLDVVVVWSNMQRGYHDYEAR